MKATQANIVSMCLGVDQPGDVDDGPNLLGVPLNTLLGFDSEIYLISTAVPFSRLDAMLPQNRRRG